MNFFARYLPLALVAVGFRGFGQTPATALPPPAQTQPAAPSTAKVEMPSDPAALLELVSKKNGLRNAILAPWHLKATYEVLDRKGQSQDAGTFEEFWVSASKYRTSYSSPSFNQTSIADENGVYRQGDTGNPRGAASLVSSTLLYQGFFSHEKGKYAFSVDDRVLGTVKLKCITVNRMVFAPTSPLSVDCLNLDLPVLRISVRANASLQTMYNDIALFEGAYVANNVEVKSGSWTILRIRIVTLESYATKDDSLFAVPPKAVLTPRRALVSDAVTIGNNTKKVTPRYPVDAKQQHIQGVVVLHAVISTDGKISDIQPIIGPSELIPSSVDAAKQWEYRPYLLNGVPVEVETDIDFVYSLGTTASAR